MKQVSFSLAFFAGIISFVSPCVLPLIPGYVSFITGVTFDQKPKSQLQTLLPLISFVLGFTLVFTLLGASATLVGATLKTNQLLLTRIAGILLIIVGLHLSGLKIKLLHSATNQSLLQRAQKSSSFVMGLAFAVGWTPCIGPILGAILVFASTAGTASLGSALLLTYSLGLGIPFILFGQSFAVAKYRSDWLRKHTHSINKIGGLLMILMGILLFFNKLSVIAIYLQRVIPKGWQYF